MGSRILWDLDFIGYAGECLVGILQYPQQVFFPVQLYLEASVMSSTVSKVVKRILLTVLLSRLKYFSVRWSSLSNSPESDKISSERKPASLQVLISGSA